VTQQKGATRSEFQASHQRFERCGIVVHAAQQHRLAHHRNAGVDDARAGGAHCRRQFARMIGMQRHVGRTSGVFSARTRTA
jgi:hypothetical protein